MKVNLVDIHLSRREIVQASAKELQLTLQSPSPIGVRPH